MFHGLSDGPQRSRRFGLASGFATILSAVLVLAASPSPGPTVGHQAALPGQIIIDTSSPGWSNTGQWGTSGLDGSHGQESRYSRPPWHPSTATWRPDIQSGGAYDVYIWYPAHENRASNSPFTVSHASGTDVVHVDQTTQGSQWNLIGTYTFNAGTSGSVQLTTDADGQVGADAVAFVPQGEPAPFYRSRQLLFDADPENAKPFLAFPTVLKVDNNQVVVSYKRGDTHSQDPDGALLETIRYNPSTQQVINRTITGNTSDVVYQNPQYVPMPNGDILLLVDRQEAGSPVVRIGLEEFKSTDGGDTFSSQGPLGTIGSYEYGYASDYVIDGNTVYLLAMTFPDLGSNREVHVIKTTNNGSSWQFVANLTENFDLTFNESALESDGTGFLVIARADSAARAVAFRTDANFQVVDERDLTAQYPTIPTIARPRIIVEDGEYYLLSPSRPSGQSILRLHHIDPATLEITDSLELVRTTVTTDSYYSEDYTQVSGGDSYLNVIVHEKFKAGGNPDIVRWEFRWDQLQTLD